MVERPARECVKLLRGDDTTLLEDIKAVHDLGKEVLDDGHLLGGTGPRDGDDGLENVVTYACNQLVHLDSVFSSAAVDIGTQARSTLCSSAMESCREEIWKAESELHMMNDYDYDIFDINVDYDTIYDENLCLL